MADKKIIAVVGSTGSQGGGLIHAILNDPNGGLRLARSPVIQIKTRRRPSPPKALKW